MNYDPFEALYPCVDATFVLDPNEDLLKSAVRYARIRGDWMMADAEVRMALEGHRKVAHDAFIDACHILARNMAKRGEACVRRRPHAGRKGESGFRLGSDHGGHASSHAADLAARARDLSFFPGGKDEVHAAA